MFDQDTENAPPRALRTSLEILMARMGLARADTQATLAEHWRQLFGPELAVECQLIGIRDEVLIIGVTDPAVAEHLRWMRADLIAAVNELCGGEVIRDVRIKVGHSAP